VYLHKVLHSRGLLESLESKADADAPVFVGDDEPDYEFEVIIEALMSLSDAVWSNYSEYDEVETMYFSHPDIMEFYRLCREHSRLAHVPLRANPYMQKARRFVDSCLDQGCPVCDYRLQTKTNHKWASGIVFKMWPEFENHLVLLILMAKIFDYYTRELARLKAELAEMKSGPHGPQEKEAA
jgi:hypothetical protein